VKCREEINISIFTCPFCQEDSAGNHAWNCPMNPINVNNKEFQYITVNDNNSDKSLLYSFYKPLKNKALEHQKS
jgi:hypothetical protein